MEPLTLKFNADACFVSDTFDSYHVELRNKTFVEIMRLVNAQVEEFGLTIVGLTIELRKE